MLIKQIYQFHVVRKKDTTVLFEYRKAVEMNSLNRYEALDSTTSIHSLNNIVNYPVLYLAGDFTTFTFLK